MPPAKNPQALEAEKNKYSSATVKLQTDYNRFRDATARMVHGDASEIDAKYAKEDLLRSLGEVMAIAKKVEKLKRKRMD